MTIWRKMMKISNQEISDSIIRELGGIGIEILNEKCPKDGKRVADCIYDLVESKRAVDQKEKNDGTDR